MFYKVTLGFTTGATYNMTHVHVFKAAQARRAYFLLSWSVFKCTELIVPISEGRVVPVYLWMLTRVLQTGEVRADPFQRVAVRLPLHQLFLPPVRAVRQVLHRLREEESAATV